MGRDDAKTIPGLQGGTLPARAFAAFMKIATAGRPIETFDTQVTLPEWQLDNESDFGQPDNGLFVDPDGNPLPQDQIAPDDSVGGGDAGQPPQSENDPPQTAPDATDGPDGSAQRPDERLDRKWIDRMTGSSGGDPNRPKRVVPPADRPREIQPPRPTQ
jgi:penicillin-binding protein 1A